MAVQRGKIHQLSALSGVLIFSSAAIAIGPEVIYTEIVTSPTSVAPGMLDLAGQPVVGRITALFDLNVAHDGSQWVVRADTDLPTTHDQVLLLGTGNTGAPLAQDGQPVPGSTTSELYDFFDGPVPASWDDKSNIAFSARARPSTNIKEKVLTYSKGTYTLVHTESQPVTGLVDVPANPTGDELLGNSINSVHLLNSGLVGFIDTPIQNCHSTRYPAFFRGTVGFNQSGVTALNPPNDNEIWDSFDFDNCGGAPDGANWFAVGDTENPVTTLDRIFAVNNNKIVQENTEIAGTGVIAADIFFVRMLTNGDWFARGDDTFPDNDWALKGNGTSYTLLAKTGVPIITGSDENWGTVFSAFNGNTDGDWVLAGNTSNPDTTKDNVLVLNGEEIIAREGDPIDVDGNGLFDDDAFIGATTLTGSAFTPDDLFITNNGVIYVVVVLRNGANVSLGDAFLRIPVGGGPSCVADIAPPGGNGTIDVDDLVQVINDWGPCQKGQDCAADINQSGAVDVDDLLEVINGWGSC